MIIKRKVKKNQIHVVRQAGKPTRVFSECESYIKIPAIVPVWGMFVWKISLDTEHVEHLLNAAAKGFRFIPIEKDRFIPVEKDARELSEPKYY